MAGGLVPVEPVVQKGVVVPAFAWSRKPHRRRAGHQDQGVPLFDPVFQRGDFFAGQPHLGPQDEQDADSLERLGRNAAAEAGDAVFQSIQHFVSGLRAGADVEEGRGQPRQAAGLFRRRQQPVEQRHQQGSQQQDAQEDAINAG